MNVISRVELQIVSIEYIRFRLKSLFKPILINNCPNHTSGWGNFSLCKDPPQIEKFFIQSSISHKIEVSISLLGLNTGGRSKFICHFHLPPPTFFVIIYVSIFRLHFQNKFLSICNYLIEYN